PGLLSGCGRVNSDSITPIASALRAAERHQETGAPARIRGIVTYWEQQAGDCFLQDGSGGIRVLLRKDQAELRIGQEVEATGLVRVDDAFASLIEPTMVALRDTTVPAARPVRIDTGDLSKLVSQRIAFTGTVESSEHGRVGIQELVVRSHQGRAHVRVRRVFGVDPDKFPGDEFEVEGILVRTGSAAGSADRLQNTIEVWSPDTRSMRLLHHAGPPGGLPVSGVGSLTHLSPKQFPDHWVRVQGVVSSVMGVPRIADGSGSMTVRLSASAEAGAGVAADLFGFLEQENGETVLANAEPVVAAAASHEELRTAFAVHHLPLKLAALRLPVHLDAVVTFYKPALSTLFIQDRTDGMYVQVKSTHMPSLKTGDHVDVRGVTLPGDFAPNVGEAVFRVLGTSPMPAPETDLEVIFSSKMDCRWVELNGVVQDAAPRENGSLLGLVWGNHTFKAQVDVPYSMVRGLIDQHVVLRGVIGTIFNNRRQVLGVQIYVPALRFIRTIHSSAPDLSTTTVRPVGSLLQFSPDTNIGHRVRVQGIVMASHRSGPTWIRDSSGGLLISSHDPVDLKPGDLVDVLGFPESASFGPAMHGASIITRRSGLPFKPLVITPEDALGGVAESQLVTVDGTVLQASAERTDMVATLRSGPYLFVVRLPLTERGASTVISRMKPGVQARVTGICSATVDHQQDWLVPRGFEILMRSPDDLVVLKNASWFTTGHVALLLLGTVLSVLICVCWILTLRRNVSRQTLRLTIKTRELEEANALAHQAVRVAQQAKAIEQGRQVILEMVARDAPLAGIMSQMMQTLAAHLPGAACFVELDLAGQAGISAASGATQLTGLPLSALTYASGMATLSAFAEMPEGAWPELPEELRGLHYLAVPIVLGSQQVGAIVAAWPKDACVTAEEVSLLESWGQFAGLAVERRGFYDQLSHRARFDDLTSLHNRASLYEHLGAQLSGGGDARTPTGLVYLDLDGFKKINDTYGHDTGDMVLKEVARRIRRSIRHTDLAARIGGDEFIVVLPGIRDRAEAERIAELLVSSITQPISSGSIEIGVGASHGISIFPDDSPDIEALIRDADHRMYLIKSTRKSSARGGGMRREESGPAEEEMGRVLRA
ncbi:MAG TPA: diguanylate cyclase, partial [Acidobacteriaceae bacterium]